ncbi:LTA synthase family protein [Halomonas huangheensis]|uniref:Sulfatase N-terminal domain-containing protein n=1 Tax=Halomonas huangheensis TaxID=1178482 RepID=W1NB08_9GAMM|nr:LTA synthase family protein [Halomonas huangheensis]ALM53728.1 hypothetical protein AR456_16695 [Halomonas huangheensis]ERL52356.1 hypothetical protein BJB45_10340 [Halomonas huangheensis]
MILLLVIPATLSLVLSLVCERLLQPLPAPMRQRSAATLGIHIGSWLVLYALALLVLQRGWLSAGLLNVLHLVLIQSCRSKWSSLKEPFLVQDFEYFLDAIRHPRLYVPFFGLGLAIAASTSGAAAFLAFLWWEPSLMTVEGVSSWLLSVANIAAAGVLLLGVSLARRPSICLHPEDDLYRHGLISYFWAYGLHPTAPIDPTLVPECFRLPQLSSTPASASASASATATATPAALPHIVIVQSEAFFDPREWQTGLPRELMPNWDSMKRQGIASGPLTVPVWGANTVRSEAAFLTGIDNAALGMHRFTPYRPLAKQPLPSLVSALKQIGYRCVTVHPYPASFYDRARVMPVLGFDEFIDIKDFDASDRDGQYISDSAVARKVHALLEQSTEEPLMVFAITMENHGPLHLEAAASEWRDRLPHDTEQQLASQDADMLAVYLRHLHNADSMLGELRHSLNAQARHGLLCWYGDHVPIMEGAYATLGEPSGETQYLLWSTLAASDPIAVSDPIAAFDPVAAFDQVAACDPVEARTTPMNIAGLAERLWQDLARFQPLREQTERRAAYGTPQQGNELQEQQ